MRALSLFSGIGGLDRAAHAVGIETVAFCEIEPFACRILAKRFPGVPIINDVREVIADGSLGAIDVVHGGFPCQDLSVAGKQRGLSGERSGLWYEMLRVISELRPAYVLAENVRGACNLALPAVVSGLEGEGYEVRASVVPASAFGAPHKRERLFVLGVRRDVVDSACERLQRLWTTREQESEVHAGKIVPVRDSIGSGKLWPTPKAGACGMTARTSGRPIEKSTHLTTQVFLAEQQAKLWPTPRAGKTSDEKLDSWLARRERGEVATPPLSLAVRMWATPSSADCKGSHGGGQGRSLRTDIHEIKKMWPTPSASSATIQDMEQAKFAGNDPNRPKYSEVKSVGSLNPAWVECLQNFPIGWTDPDCDEPEPWPGWPAMMGERLWMTPKAGACGMTAKTKGRPLEMSTHLSAQTFVAERDYADQYPYEPPRTGTGIPHRAARLKALGNSVVPAQAYPFFEAIAIMEEVRTQCNTASST